MGWTIDEYKNGNDIITVIDIDSIDPFLENLIDKHIADIVYGKTVSKYLQGIAKSYIKQFISKSDRNRKIGAVSEFFVHLYLIYCGLEQYSIFKNLEEKSFPKGFDGVYKDSSGDVWFVESKSGDFAEKITHQNKVEEAYDDLKKKLSNNSDGDPWTNAIYHMVCIESDDTLLEEFALLAQKYMAGEKLDLKERNISPCGTIFDDTGTKYDSSVISHDLFASFTGKEYRKLYSLCITNRALKQFEEYLDD